MTRSSRHCYGYGPLGERNVNANTHTLTHTRTNEQREREMVRNCAGRGCRGEGGGNGAERRQDKAERSKKKNISALHPLPSRLKYKGLTMQPKQGMQGISEAPRQADIAITPLSETTGCELCKGLNLGWHAVAAVCGLQAYVFSCAVLLQSHNPTIPHVAFFVFLSFFGRVILLLISLSGATATNPLSA